MPMDEDLFNVGENDDMLDDENNDHDQNDSDMDLDDANNGHGNDDNNAMDINDDDGEEDDEGEDGEEGEEGEEEDDDGEGDENDENDENDDEEENDDNEEENDENENEENDENDEHDNEGENDENDQRPQRDTAGYKDDGSPRNGGTPSNGDTHGNTQKRSKSPQNRDTKEAPSADSAAKVDSFAIREKAREAVKTASEFDIVPIVAIPYAQQCHSVAISEGPKWILTGGEDGFIRKYDFAASIDGKAPLTVAQKHNLMDNINKAGVIGSYWENEQPMTKSQILNENPKFRASDFTTGFVSYEPKVNPVYSLDVERNGLWCLSGVLSGGISLYTMIYNEGAIHHYFPHDRRKNGEPTLDSGHSDAVSVLRLNHAQNAVLSGSWDKTIREWDLHTGKTKSLYRGSTGQISSIQFRPTGLTDLTFDDATSDVDSLFGSDQEDDENGDNGDNGDNDANISRSSIRTDASRNRTISDDKIFMSSSIDGAINIWDARVSGSAPALRLGVPDSTPPWCMTASWSNDGDKIFVGRRNSTVEEFSLRMPHEKRAGNVSVPNVSKRLMFPKISGPVSSLSVMPNDNFIFCGSNDNIRLYNLNLYDEFTQETATAKKRATPFYVIPGHHGGVLSNLLVDETGRFMISTSGNRGWGHSSYADVVLIYSIDTETPQQ